MWQGDTKGKYERTRAAAAAKGYKKAVSVPASEPSSAVGSDVVGVGRRGVGKVKAKAKAK
jgi:hypothetical protein